MAEEDERWERWFALSLRVWGDHLPLDEIESALDLPPERIGRIGQPIPRHVPDRIPLDRVARFRTNFWLWKSPRSSDVPIEGQIESLIATLEARRDELKQILSTPGATGDIALGFGGGAGQQGAVLSPKLLSRIGSLGLALWLDLYPPSGDNDGSQLSADHDAHTD